MLSGRITIFSEKKKKKIKRLIVETSKLLRFVRNYLYKCD